MREERKQELTNKKQNTTQRCPGSGNILSSSIPILISSISQFVQIRALLSGSRRAGIQVVVGTVG